MTKKDLNYNQTDVIEILDYEQFFLAKDLTPAGDQPKAIKQLSNNEKNQVLLGVTGSGKTLTMANVIANLNKPALIIAPNKTLAAQLYGEMKIFFPQNAVEYFVSYYDFYQPEAYVPRTDTYIEKQATINESIDQMRHSATRSLLERKDVIIVASVSCIYGLGAVETYSKMVLELKIGDIIDHNQILEKLTQLLYRRNDMNFTRGTFRVRGENLYIFPSHYQDRAWHILLGEGIEKIREIDPLTGAPLHTLDSIKIYANSHFVTPRPSLEQAVKSIEIDLKIQLENLYKQNKIVEAQRLERKIKFDIEKIRNTGTCSGIENYSIYLSGRQKGSYPPTLFEYFPSSSLLIIDESHVTIPQIGAMYKGDSVRKATLIEYGFRLPSCADNRPLKFEEWDALRPQTLFVSATPNLWEVEQSKDKIVEQLIRPTGLLDPKCEVLPTENQIDSLIEVARKVIANNSRVLVTTLTKKMAESLAQYLHEAGMKAKYMHSDIDTLERIAIIDDLRSGVFDILIGINLLREGLDIPECELVIILDADSEGFLRSKTSLIQTIGRAARNINGRVILYADTITKSMKAAIFETNRRRKIQEEHNKKNDIIITGIKKEIRKILPSNLQKNSSDNSNKSINISAKERQRKMKILEKEMKHAALNLEFEKAAKLRDELHHLQSLELELFDIYQ